VILCVEIIIHHPGVCQWVYDMATIGRGIKTPLEVLCTLQSIPFKSYLELLLNNCKLFKR
jgi:hypothetical protein